MTRAAAVLIAAAMVARPGAVAADPEDWRFAAWADYEASYVQRRTAAADAPAAGDGLVLAGLRLRALVSRTSPVRYLIGLDLQAGATRPAGFAYQVDLYPIGAAVPLGATGGLGVGVGVGASGATGTADDAVELPVEACLQLALGGRVRFLARGRAVWLGASRARQDGAPSASWTDELDGTVALRWGRRYREFDFPSGNGYFAGVAYREAEGARFVGAVIGYSVDIGAR